jgi:D-3-phosphoglycerate dehydrogenase / 2-oxoglutarate reductase
MARYGSAFGMRCIGYDPAPPSDVENLELVSFADVLASSDVVSVHVPLTPETTGMITAREIAQMKDGVIIVNTSRGEVVEESALLDGLKSGKIGALGVDVLIGEPDTRESRLLQYARDHDNVLITPHIGGFSPDALRFVMQLMCGRIREQFAAARA